MVETAGDADREAFGGESFDDHRNAIRERDRHGDGLLGVRTATEAVVLLLRSWSTSVFLDSRFAATQPRHHQVRRRPRQQEAGHDADDDVPADNAHSCQDTSTGLNPQVGLSLKRARRTRTRRMSVARCYSIEVPQLAPCRNAAQPRASTEARPPTRAESRLDSIRREGQVRLHQ